MKPATRMIFWSILATTILLVMWMRVHQNRAEAPIYAEYTNKTIYLDSAFSLDEEQIIEEAADEWDQATDGRVNYIIVKLPVKNIDVSKSIVMIKKSPYDPEVLEQDFTNHNMTLGYFTHTEHITYIALVPIRINLSDYKTVVLHEFGHSLGLRHNGNLVIADTVMRPLISDCSKYISDVDLYNFCDVHHCTSWNLHDQEKPTHP